MIVGKIEYRPEKESSYFHLTFFIETDEKIKECPQVEDRISEFYLSQQNVVTLLGEKNGRVVLMVVAQLENVDLYRALIDYHLSRTADFELKCYDICEKLKELESCLTRVILFENNRVATIDSIPDEDPLLSILSFGGYEFNDFILAETEFLLPAESKSLSSADLAAVEAAQLLRMIKTYPPPNGLLFNIIKFQDEMHYFTMNYRSERQKVAILKPKYPVNAFNMFAKNEHEALKKEFSQFPISNNELNQIMGQRWKGMSGEQKLPFLQLAAADKIRYKEVRLRVLMC